MKRYRPTLYDLGILIRCHEESHNNIKSGWFLSLADMDSAWCKWQHDWTWTKHINFTIIFCITTTCITYQFTRLTHQGWLRHICVYVVVNLTIVYVVVNLTIIDSYNGLWSMQCQAINWSNDGISVWPLGTNFREFQSKCNNIHTTELIWKCFLAKWAWTC